MTTCLSETDIRLSRHEAENDNGDVVGGRTRGAGQYPLLDPPVHTGFVGAMLKVTESRIDIFFQEATLIRTIGWCINRSREVALA